MCSDRTDREISIQQDCRETLSFYPWPVWYIVLYKYSIVLSINQTKTKRPIWSFLHIGKPLLAFRKLDEIIVSNYSNVALHYILNKVHLYTMIFPSYQCVMATESSNLSEPWPVTLTLTFVGLKSRTFVCYDWMHVKKQSHNPHQLNHTFSCYTFVFAWVKPTGCNVYVGVSVPFEENHACCFPPFPDFWLWHLSKYLTLDNPKYLGKELCWTSTLILKKKVKYRFSPGCVPYYVIGAVDGRCWNMSATMKWKWVSEYLFAGLK